jgi:GT2 family glycosyltransferase
MLLWSSLLEKFKIVGVDINDLISPKVRNNINPNVEFIFTDAYNQNAVYLLNKLYPEGFDVIVDDGPHNEQSQIECIKLYFPLLKNGGFLVIEDIQNAETVNRLADTLNEFNNLYDYEVKVYDYRHRKGRYDDLVFAVKKISKKPIPVIGTAIVNSPFWLSRLIESVDYPVDEFVIINNNGRGEITEELNAISKKEHKYIKKIKVCHLPYNIGCSGAWNLIIKSYMLAPYWVIANHDVEFSPGLLEEFQKNSSDKAYGTIHASEHKGVGMFDMFLLKDWAVQGCGLFDENLYPAYAEDIDYILRLRNINIKSKILNIHYLHGDVDYETTGSQTWRSDLTLKDKLSNSLRVNEWEYLTEKWGSNWRSLQTYKTPFNNQSFNNKYTTYDLDFVRKKHLGF